MSYEYQKTTTASRREERRENTRYLHVSCEARMIADPRDALDGKTRPMIPWVSKGVTYDKGRNAAKILRRADA